MVGTIVAQEAEGGLAPSTAENVGFEAVYDRYGRSLFGTALRMLRRPEEAEEVVQDTFLAYHRRSPGLSLEQLGAWLHRVLVNRCLDRLRRGQRWKTSELSDEAMGQCRGSGGLAVDLEAAVSRLPDKARLVFLLHDVEGLSHRELGSVLGFSEGTSKSQLFRARQMLRGFMRGAE